MKRILRNPITNAAGIALFTAFYAAVFLGVDFKARMSTSLGGFWARWGNFLASGGHRAYVWILVAVCVLTVLLLLTRRRAYDEYHAGVLLLCLSVGTVLTLFFIAAFFLLILLDPSGSFEKFTLFAATHWAVVAIADLAYVLACRWG